MAARVEIPYCDGTLQEIFDKLDAVYQVYSGKERHLLHSYVKAMEDSDAEGPVVAAAFDHQAEKLEAQGL